MSDLDTEQKPSRQLWLLAGIAALALHIGGGALAVAHLRTDALDESLGAPAIEISLEMMSPHLEETDLPPGPDADASVASPALAEQKVEVKQAELPKEVPTETDDPDRAVTANDSNKPRDDDPKIAAAPTAAAVESVAQEATARQTLENAREGETPVAPHQGLGKDDRKLTEKSNGQLEKAMKVKVNFVLDRLGHVVSMNVVEGSGDSIYDEAALSMIRRSDPLPRPPPTVADEGLSFTVDVVFQKSKG